MLLYLVARRESVSIECAMNGTQHWLTSTRVFDSEGEGQLWIEAPTNGIDILLYSDSHTGDHTDNYELRFGYLGAEESSELQIRDIRNMSFVTPTNKETIITQTKEIKRERKNKEKRENLDLHLLAAWSRLEIPQQLFVKSSLGWVKNTTHKYIQILLVNNVQRGYTGHPVKFLTTAGWGLLVPVLKGFRSSDDDCTLLWALHAKRLLYTYNYCER